MDANKLTVLRDIDYRIGPACGLCKHGWFTDKDWGLCKQRTYEHLKHGDTRYLSIHKFGSCEQFESDPNRRAPLGAFEEFVEV